MEKRDNIMNTTQTLSDSLRNRKKQHSLKNKSSTFQEKDMTLAVESTLDWLRNEYPQHEFGWQKKVMLKTIYNTLREQYGLVDIYLEDVKDTTFITPDGGFTYVKINGIKYYLLIGEQKTQGTNDKRLSEGKKRQPTGNAVERLGKNLRGLDLLFKKEDILPFVTFLQGCDFHETETIGDRVVTLFQGLKKNHINLYKDGIGRGGSYYMRGHKWDEGTYGESDWSIEEMTNIFKKVSQLSLEYYIDKYGK
jgi:type II restriction enzyme|tara:strand:+ start:38 stop:787 length:750 start_codon:yes stop_codon:yes gene_type:complete